MDELILEMRGICKHFPGVQALKDVDFSVKKGEVHALVGQNGAGKSTLLKILSGVYSPNAGSVVINGEELGKWTPQQIIDKGVSFIYQEMNLVQSLSVAKNMFIGRESRNALGLIDWPKMRSRAANALERIGINDIDVNKPVSELSAAKQQLIVIAAALDQNPSLLILDEPTSRLALEDSERLFELLEKMQADGISIIYVSHRLNEIYRIANRITVLRDGSHIATQTTEEMPAEKLVQNMVGEDVQIKSYASTEETAGETLLSAKDICGPGVNHINLELKAGEVMGLVGAVGGGKSELLRVLFGIEKLTSGEIRINDQMLAGGNPTEAIAKGLALCPEDRKHEGLVLDSTIRDNVTLAGLKYFSLGGIFPNRKSEDESVQNLVKRLRVATPSIKKKARALSGGNQQKVVLAKWLCTKSKVFLFDEPTVGVDVQGKAEIYELMHELAKQGSAVLFVTSDVEEGLMVSDHIKVMYKGVIIADLKPKNTSVSEISLYSMGGTPE